PMGFGLPAAIGASIARPDKSVVAACGDGGMHMAMGELLTAARERVGNLRIVVFNNCGLGSTRDVERRISTGRMISDFDEWIDFVRHGLACGVESVLIRDRQQLPMIAKSIRTPGLKLYDCRIDPTEAM